MNFTKEIYERLTKYRNSLYNACYLDYVRLTSMKDKEELSAIYKEHFSKDSGIMGGCSRCILRDCKALGKLYFEDEKVYKQLELKSQETDTEEVNNKEEKTATNNGEKKTRGRRKSKGEGNN